MEEPITLPENTLRDHIFDLVTQALNRRDREQIERWGFELKDGPLIPVNKQPTLRDQFAMAALSGLLSQDTMPSKYAAEDSYTYADAMLKAREK